jgi:hypothetical protein
MIQDFVLTRRLEQMGQMKGAVIFLIADARRLIPDCRTPPSSFLFLRERAVQESVIGNQ